MIKGLLEVMACLEKVVAEQQGLLLRGASFTGEGCPYQFPSPPVQDGDAPFDYGKEEYRHHDDEIGSDDVPQVSQG